MEFQCIKSGDSFVDVIVIVRDGNISTGEAINRAINLLQLEE